jgi:hypothetical protein
MGLFDSMELFKQLISYFALASLGFTVVEVYLRANRLWKQKHEPAVAESISILSESELTHEKTRNRVSA